MIFTNLTKITICNVLQQLGTYWKEAAPKRTVRDNSDTKFSEIHTTTQNIVTCSLCFFSFWFSQPHLKEKINTSLVPACRNQFFFHVSWPQWPFNLNSCYWMNGMSPSNGWNRGLWEANVFYFSFFNQFLKLPHLGNYVQGSALGRRPRKLNQWC